MLASGNMFFKSQETKDIAKAYEFYDEANKLLDTVVGSKSVDFLHSMVDIGEVYLYQRNYEQALAFLNFVKNEIVKYYGESSIYKNRVNSALIEVHSETQVNKGDYNFQLSLENLRNAISLYGENSIFCLGYYMSIVSAYSTKGNFKEAENILIKMMRILEKEGELKNGNQYFFLASVLNGVICYHTQKYDQAHLLFTSTLKRQLEYVGFEKDHPFLEQTYYHMAMMFKQLGNLNSSLIMWKNVLATGKRKYGENSFLLASNYKQIGTCEIGLNKLDEAIFNLEKAKALWKSRLDTLDNKLEIKLEKREIAEIYFAFYLAYVAKLDWDGAISANDQACKYNTEVLGEEDLNVANNHYLGSQMYLKKLQVTEALHYAQKANDIMDKKPHQEPLLFVRYRFLRAKLYKNLDKNSEALKDLDEGILRAENNQKLYMEEIEMK